MKQTHILAVLLASALSACAGHPSVPDDPTIWCNTSHFRNGVFGIAALDIARKGYIYSLSASLALDNEPAWFKAPDRLIQVDSTRHDSTGFLVTTFELKNLDDPALIDEVIIAYAVTNPWHDWTFVDVPFWGRVRPHHEQGRIYAQEVIEKYQARMPIVPPIVVTGAAWGGGIAVYVTTHQETGKRISKAWIFNSSPKALTHGDPDERIWAASMKADILHPFSGFFSPTPGLDSLMLAKGHSHGGYSLVQSNAVFQHYHYVLTRNLLHAADYAMKISPSAGEKLKSEPIAILERSSDRSCMSPSHHMPAHMRW